MIEPYETYSTVATFIIRCKYLIFGGKPRQVLPSLPGRTASLFSASIVPGPKLWPWTVRSLCDSRAVGEDGLVNQPVSGQLDDRKL